MQPNEMIELEKRVAQLGADISILENTVDNLKSTDDRLEAVINKISNDIVALRLSLNDRFNSINNDILSAQQKLNVTNNTISKLSQEFNELKNSVDKVSKNSLLEMTSSFGIKQLVTVIVLLASIITTPGLLADYIGGSNSTENKIDTLIELLQEGTE